jgi:hypothetical protein
MRTTAKTATRPLSTSPARQATGRPYGSTHSINPVLGAKRIMNSQTLPRLGLSRDSNPLGSTDSASKVDLDFAQVAIYPPVDRSVQDADPIGEGQPLDSVTKAFFGLRFGHDFSQVRVHTNDRATEAAASLQANAFTVGHDIVFGAGQYHPETSTGKRLIAHELAHVLQQPKALVVQRQSNSPPRQWTPNDYAIIIWHGTAGDLGSECSQTVDGSGQVVREGCGPVRPPFCQSARREYTVEFLIDWGGPAGRPYPPGRQMPYLSAQFRFITTGGRETITMSARDRSPIYTGPGDSLRGSLDRRFPISTAESGTLFVTAQLEDPVTRRTYTNSLSIEFIIEPCV